MQRIPPHPRSCFPTGCERGSPACALAGSSPRQRAAWDRRYKLVEYPRLEGGYRRALYDRIADPAESANLIDAHPEVAARLDAELRAWSASIPSHAPPPERDEEQLEMLRALGYVD